MAELAGRAAARVTLADGLRARLPGPLAGQLRGANLRDDGTLVILAATSAWAARLRFEAEALLACARELAPEASRVEVRVAGPGAAGDG